MKDFFLSFQKTDIRSMILVWNVLNLPPPLFNQWFCRYFSSQTTLVRLLQILSTQALVHTPRPGLVDSPPFDRLWDCQNLPNHFYEWGDTSHVLRVINQCAPDSAH